MEAESSVSQIARSIATYCDSSMPLTDVFGQYLVWDGPPALIALRLEFGNQVLLLTALEDDSLKVRANEDFLALADHAVTQLTQTSPWKSAVSRPLMWAWVMVNQQGYLDGIQLDFARSSEDEAARIQVLVIGSSLKLQH